MPAEKFHVDNEVIITTNDEVDVEEVFNYLKGRLHEFREKSEFIVICGYHTNKAGEIGAIDSDVLYDYYGDMMQRFHDHKRYPNEAKVIKEKQFQMGSIIPVNTIRDWSQKPDEVYSLAESTKEQIKIKFRDVLFKQVPIVLVLASCYSYKSDIFYTLRATGLWSAINMLQDNGNITHGKLIQLDAEQRTILNAVANGEMKDVIVGGKYKIEFKIGTTF